MQLIKNVVSSKVISVCLSNQLRKKHLITDTSSEVTTVVSWGSVSCPRLCRHPSKATVALYIKKERHLFYHGLELIFS